MPNIAIMRWNKLVDQKQADAATGHNFRGYDVPNTDKEARYPNHEYVNEARLGYWELANERIAAAGVKRKVRDNAIRCEEVLLTASPEFFKRDENGRAEDMRESQWGKDNFAFLERKFGRDNILSFTLHQDEKSPHIHAVIAPITPDGRLSAKELFSPKTLVTYQDEYAEAMKPHGLERGVRHSQAKHQEMQRMYGQQDAQHLRFASELGVPAAYQPIQVTRPGMKDMLNLEAWERKMNAQVNELAQQQVVAANQRAVKAEQLARENAAASEQVKVLRAQLHVSERLKDGHYQSWQAEQAGRGAETRWGDETARRLAGGEPAPAEWLARGNALLDQAAQQVFDGRQNLARLRREHEQAEQLGNYDKVAKLRAETIPAAEASQQAKEAFLAQYAGGAGRLTKLETEAKNAEEVAEKLAVAKLVAQAAERMQQAREQAYTVFVATAKHGDYDDLSSYVGLVIKQGYSFKNKGNETTAILAPGGIELPAAEFRPDGKTIGGLVIENLLARDQQARAQEQVTAARELALMGRAFTIYGWRVGSEHLTACLLVPVKEAAELEKQLRANLGTLSAVGSLAVQGEPNRTDGLQAIYVKYPQEVASRAGAHFDQLREAGDAVYEPAEHQRRREQLQAHPLPSPKVTREFGLTQSNVSQLER